MTLSLFAITKLSNPGLWCSSARMTAWAPSRASIYVQRFHFRDAGSASKEGNSAYSEGSMTLENRNPIIFS